MWITCCSWQSDVGIRIEWFDSEPARDQDRGSSRRLKTMVRSFYEAPNRLYLNNGAAG